MATAEAAPGQHPADKASLPWRGSVAFALLAVVGLLGPDITPSPYIPDLDYYIPRYVLLALSIGFGLDATRSRWRIDQLFGIAVVMMGSGTVAYIVWECLRQLGW